MVRYLVTAFVRTPLGSLPPVLVVCGTYANSASNAGVMWLHFFFYGGALFCVKILRQMAITQVWLFLPCITLLKTTLNMGERKRELERVFRWVSRALTASLSLTEKWGTASEVGQLYFHERNLVTVASRQEVDEARSVVMQKAFSKISRRDLSFVLGSWKPCDILLLVLISLSLSFLSKPW